MMSQILNERLILSAANSEVNTLVVCQAYNQGIFSLLFHESLWCSCCLGWYGIKLWIGDGHFGIAVKQSNRPLIIIDSISWNSN